MYHFSRRNHAAFTGGTGPMKSIALASILVMGIAAAAVAQPASAPAQIMTAPPAGSTISNFYKQNVYDPQDNKIGSIDDMLLDNDGRVTAVLIGVGGFLGMGEKDVAVAFNSLQATQKDNAWHLTLNTTKDALKNAPGLTYDKSASRWVPANK
jgi:sporulation protein YlmC with PRC-barrel domain